MTYLSYRMTGSGTPLLLLHAMPLDSTMYDEVRGHLDTVLTVDAPGFGKSPSGSEIDSKFGATAPSLDTLAEAVIADLEEMGIDRVFLGGLSMGGAVAVSILEKAPDLVAGLVLMDTNIGADAPEAREKRLEAANKADDGDVSSVYVMADTMTSPVTKEARPEVYADISRRLHEVQGPSLAWMQRAMAARPDRRHLIDTLDIPLLLIRGEDDASCTAEMMEGLAGRYQGSATVATITSAGHFTALETPGELAGLLSEFVSGK